MPLQAGSCLSCQTLGISGETMKLVKILGALVVAVVLLFLFIVKFSAVESRFECPGKLTSKDGSHPVTAYIKFEEYRWWVGLWRESDAALYLEIPNTAFDYFGYVKRVGDQYQIFGSQKNLKGNLSTLSKTLALSTSVGFFDGVCKKND